MKTEAELFNELKNQTSSEETKELIKIANNLKRFSELKLSKNKKEEFLEKINKKEVKASFFWRVFFIPSLTFAVLLLLISAPIVLAQKSLPGEALYPLKKISENAAVIIRPQVKEDVVVRRSEEVKKLVEKKSEEKLIKETLKEYKKEARLQRESRQSRKENIKTEKSEKSLENLKEAREKMEEEDKEEIEEAIEELEESEKEMEDLIQEVKGERDLKEKFREKLEED